VSYPGTLRYPNSWGTTIYSTADGTRPATGYGTSVTPAQNAYGSFVTLISGANLTVDCLDLTICVNNVGITTVARDCVVALGIDQAGGTSFTTIADLVCGPACGYAFGSDGMTGTVFRFPLWLKSGWSIGVAGAVNSATLTAFNVFCKVRGAPSHPECLWVGTGIEQYGVTLASSSGTTVTPGTTSEGAYAQIGTTTKAIYAIEFGYGINDSTMSQANLDVDIAVGDATNKLIAIPNAPISTSALESIAKLPALEYVTAAASVNVYARAQSSGTVDSANSVAVYGVF
jgi:hypothetical protein